MNTDTNPCTGAVTRGPMHTMQLVLGLCKLRIGVMIMITALVGLLVTPGPAPAVIQVVVTALSVLLASASARHESRGTHSRSDFPDRDAAFAHRFFV